MTYFSRSTMKSGQSDMSPSIITDPTYGGGHMPLNSAGGPTRDFYEPELEMLEECDEQSSAGGESEHYSRVSKRSLRSQCSRKSFKVDEGVDCGGGGYDDDGGGQPLKGIDEGEEDEENEQGTMGSEEESEMDLENAMAVGRGHAMGQEESGTVYGGGKMAAAAGVMGAGSAYAASRAKGDGEASRAGSRTVATSRTMSSRNQSNYEMEEEEGEMIDVYDDEYDDEIDQDDHHDDHDGYDDEHDDMMDEPEMEAEMSYAGGSRMSRGAASRGGASRFGAGSAVGSQRMAGSVAAGSRMGSVAAGSQMGRSHASSSRGHPAAAASMAGTDMDDDEYDEYDDDDGLDRHPDDDDYDDYVEDEDEDEVESLGSFPPSRGGMIRARRQDNDEVSALPLSRGIEDSNEDAWGLEDADDVVDEDHLSGAGGSRQTRGMIEGGVDGDRDGDVYDPDGRRKLLDKCDPMNASGEIRRPLSDRRLEEDECASWEGGDGEGPNGDSGPLGMGPPLPAPAPPAARGGMAIEDGGEEGSYPGDEDLQLQPRSARAMAAAGADMGDAMVHASERYGELDDPNMSRDMIPGGADMSRDMVPGGAEMGDAMVAPGMHRDGMVASGRGRDDSLQTSTNSRGMARSNNRGGSEGVVAGGMPMDEMDHRRSLDLPSGLGGDNLIMRRRKSGSEASDTMSSYTTGIDGTPRTVMSID
uniref:Uncharacterized protein n=1 Tax=Odontella aurita TaxID=265563 RepID=A0A7S4N745_9STRA